MIQTTALDIALIYDPATRQCDLALSAGDLALDATPATGMLVSLFTDRRARADDALPAGPQDRLNPTTLNPRRGWCGDALDRFGRQIGSRLWLLEREKQTEQVRLRAEAYATEALAELAARLGLTARVAATFPRRGVLGLAAHIGSTSVSLAVAL